MTAEIEGDPRAGLLTRLRRRVGAAVPDRMAARFSRSSRSSDKRGSRGSAEISVVVVAASLVAGLAFGEGLSRTVVDITDGLTWLADDPSGEVIQVNPATGRPERRLQVGAPGDDLQVTQSNGRLFVTNRTTGEVFSVDLASVLVSGQRRVAADDATDLLLHDDAVYLVDRSTSSISRIDASTTDAIGERWVATRGLVDASIDGTGRVWAIDQVGTLVELRWSGSDRRFVTERTEEVPHAAENSVIVGHDEGVTVFGPDAGIVVQVGTDGDVVGDAPSLSGMLAAPASSPADLVPVAAPATGTVVIVGVGEFREVSLNSIACTRPSRPAVHRELVYVPCDDTGRIVVLGRDGRRAAEDIRVPGDRDAELVVDDGNLIVNVPGSQAGLIIRPDGRIDDLTRYDERVAPTRIADAAAPRDASAIAANDRGNPGGDDPPARNDDIDDPADQPTDRATSPVTTPVDPLPNIPTNVPTDGGTNPPGTGGPGGGGGDAGNGGDGTGGGGTDDGGDDGDGDGDGSGGGGGQTTEPTDPTDPTDPDSETTDPPAEELRAPTSATATVVSEGVVEVAWNHTGPAADSFSVVASGNDTIRAGATGPQRSARVSVPLGQTLRFVVTATAPDGTTAASGQSNAVVSNGRPGAPPGVSGSVATGAHTSGSVAASVSWGEAAASGSAIQGYTVTITGGNPRSTHTEEVSAGTRTFSVQIACADTGNEECDSGTTTATVSARNAQGSGMATTVTIGESGSSVPRLPSAGRQHVVDSSGGNLGYEGFGEVTLTLDPGDWAGFAGTCTYSSGGTVTFDCAATSLTFQYNEGYRWVNCDGPGGGDRSIRTTHTIVFTAENGRSAVQSQTYSWTTTQTALCEGQQIP